MLRLASGLLGSESGSIGVVLAGSALATVRESGAGAGAGAGVALLSATGAGLVSSIGVVAQAATNSKAAPATSRRWVEFILYLPQNRHCVLLHEWAPAGLAHIAARAGQMDARAAIK